MTDNVSLLKERKRRAVKEELGWFAFILPVVLGILIFSLYPMIVSLYYSFFDKFKGLTMFPDFVVEGKNVFGLMNYKQIFDFSTGDWESKLSQTVNGYTTLKSLGFTMLYSVVSVPLNLVLSFGLALLINAKVKGVGVFRTLYYLPVLIPSVVTGALFSKVFSNTADNGLLNQMLTEMGLETYAFFKGKDTALPTMLMMNLFYMGGGMILWLSALKNVPESLIEAAKLDGAGYFRRLITVVIPMCTSVLFYNVITGVVGALQTIGSVKALNLSVDDIPFYALAIYERAGFAASKSEAAVGLACALAWILFVIVGLISIFIFKSSNWVYYEDGGK